LLQQWSGISARLEALTATEARVRELAARCRDKVMQAPPLAVPSVAAVGGTLPDIAGLTWVSMRGRITPVLSQVDRVGAALAEAERRFQAVLDRRDDLRGLVQAFADKASAAGVMELPELDSLYQEAKAVLWAAPCDLDRGAALVDRYVALVNTKVKEVAR
jgi:type IV secretory pathway TrbF-like protein